MYLTMKQRLGLGGPGYSVSRACIRTSRFSRARTRSSRAIAGSGYSKYLTDGGRGRFNCSKWWLRNILRREEWSFRKPQMNSRKLPDHRP